MPDPKSAAPAAARWRGCLQAAIGLLVSAGCLYLAARAVPLGRIWREIEHASVPLLVAATALVVAANVVRAIRWQALFAGEPGIRFRAVFGSMTVGYLANNILPARLGELIRIALLERTTQVGVGLIGATVVVERLVEALLLLIAACCLAAFVPLPASLRIGLQAATGVLLLIAGLLYLMAREEGVLLRWLDRDTRWLPAKWRIAALHGTRRFVDGIGTLRDPRLAGQVFALSLIIWAAEAAAGWVVARSLGVGLSALAALFLYTVLSVSFVLPAAPGGVGSYEAFGKLALRPFALAPGVSLGLPLVLHTVQYAASILLGIAGIWLEESLTFNDVLGGKRSGA